MKLETDDLRAELRHLSPKVTGGLLRMRQETYRDAAVAGKYKLLAAMAVSIALRCEPCIRAYVMLAHGKGVTQQELIEFLEVALTGQVQCLVTGNAKHYPTEARQGVEVLSPRVFIEIYRFE